MFKRLISSFHVTSPRVIELNPLKFDKEWSQFTKKLTIKISKNYIDNFMTEPCYNIDDRKTIYFNIYFSMNNIENIIKTLENTRKQIYEFNFESTDWDWGMFNFSINKFLAFSIEHFSIIGNRKGKELSDVEDNLIKCYGNFKAYTCIKESEDIKKIICDELILFLHQIEKKFR
jgi:hypothetical protein